jgi:hypothetical protein
LNKQEALDVIQEIHDALDAYVAVTNISLDPEQENGKVVGYSIRMKIDLDTVSRQATDKILAKHKLTLREAHGYVFISKLR